MDPLSITASTIAVVTLVAKVVQGLKGTKILHNAPADFAALVNEVFDLQVVLNEFNSSLLDQSGDFDQSRIEDMHRILQNSKDALLELNILVHYRLLRSYNEDGGIKVSRLAWLKNKNGINSLRMKLRNERNNLTFCLASIASSVLLIFELERISTDINDSANTSRVRLSIQHISMLSQDIATNQRDLRSLVFQQLGRFEKILENLLQTNLCPTHSENSQTSRFGCSSSVGNKSTSTKDATSQHELRQKRAQSKDGSAFDFEPSSTAHLAVIGVTYQGDACSRELCSCSCHSSGRLRSPQILQRVLGSLFVGYTGMPFSSVFCTEAACNGTTQQRLNVSYYFPKWFLMRALSFVFITNPVLGSDFNLRTVRLVDRSADVFHYALYGNTEGLKYLFNKKLASPHDVALNGGYTPLHVGNILRHK